ncbi:Hemin import ATP-binding protein HmuV [Frankliniella fusca]|uniref:Hemin import ATP-binding protein HmuV n=1 Tax=Frankliniella fusca TaxID=407009 RepID=A0AAE1I276_9NEOP|nr:Hemin import ATP-binding protein HmuV [Frankliniella fusca]
MRPRAALLLLLLQALLLLRAGAVGDLEHQEDAAAAAGEGLTNGTSVVLGGALGGDRVLSRHRRYIVFPKGSSIQLVAEFTVGLYVPFTTIFTTTLSWGLAWRLPSEPAGVYLNKRAAGEDPDLQHRAALARDLAALMERIGLAGAGHQDGEHLGGGEHCVRRTLCELQDPEQHGFAHRMLQALFLPTGGSSVRSADGPACRQARALCTVSLLDLPISPGPSTHLTRKRK